MKFSFKEKIIALYIVLLAIPLSIISLYFYQTTNDIVVEKIRIAGLTSMENAQEFFIVQYINSTEKAVHLIADNIRANDILDNPERLYQELENWDRYMKINSNIMQAGLGLSDGSIYVLPKWRPPAGYELHTRLWYTMAQGQSDKIVWTDPYVDAISKKTIVSVTKEVVSANKKGVIFVDTSLEGLSDIIGKIQLGENGVVMLLDSNGNIIAHKNRELLGKSVLDEPWYGLAMMDRMQDDTDFVDIDGVSTLITSVTVPQTGWRLVGFIPHSSLLKEVRHFKDKTASLTILAILAAIVASIFISAGLTDRIGKIVINLSEVEKGNFAFRCGEKFDDEFGIIAEKFNMMAETIDNLIKTNKNNEDNLRLQKGYFEHIFENSPESSVILDGLDRIVTANSQFQELFQYSLEEIQGKFINDLIVPNELTTEGVYLSGNVLNSQIVKKETQRKRKDGSLVDVFILAYPIVLEGKLTGIYTIYRDITEIKAAQKKLEYYSMYDALTGIYNRNYFQQELNKFQLEDIKNIGVILCDVDGLKLINDTFGHQAGDEMLITTAKIIQQELPKNSSIFRIGGDEFAIIVPVADELLLKDIYNRVNDKLDKYNESHSQRMISISMGCAVDDGKTESLAGLIKNADNTMYREKLQRSQSSRSVIVQMLMNTLRARDFDTDKHAERMQVLVEKLAKVAGLDLCHINDIKLLAKFHDIGKVGISDSILLKPDLLTDQERLEMQKHSEIGYRIAMSSPLLYYFPDLILKHHECWDGSGYPLGLKGNDIPVECRILSIVDAYDAMTNDRPYRNTMTKEEAINEIKRCRGSQFDPEFVDIFVELLETE